MKPRIGISTYGLNERHVESQHYKRHYVLPGEYVGAIRRAGGAPMLLPPGEESFGPWLGCLDGVVISGGTDMDPLLYGGDPSDPRIQRVDQPRDQTEMAFTGAVLEADIPALFICRGMQVLNVVRGGTVHPHLADLGNGDIHRNHEGLWTTHPVEAVAGSRVAAAMSATEANPTSGHHQGVDQIGEGLDVVAVAPDGVVEALEVPGHRWAVAVQWHPEVTAADDPTQQGIFDALVTAAKSPAS